MKKAINRNNWKKENYHTKTNTSDLTQTKKKFWKIKIIKKMSEASE